MARGDYGRIRHTFWTDPDIKRGLSPDQKTLLLYWFTSPHRTHGGAPFPCSFEDAANHTGLDERTVKLWTEGVLSKWVRRDAQSGLVSLTEACDRLHVSYVRKEPWRNQRPSLPSTVRRLVLASGRCRRCGSGERLEVDHVIPWSKGGTHEIGNLQCLCRTCNRKKGAAING